MWRLTSDTEQRVLYVVPSTEAIIGRSVDTQVCSFAIPDDASISRKHAIMSVTDGQLYIQDLGSRYGTFINEKRIEGSSQVNVNNNDSVKFGKLNSVWRVRQNNLTTCTSTMKGENLLLLKKYLENLGGILKNDWDETCAYLTMPGITLTIKVVLALAQGSHIVTIDFWSQCIEAVNKNLPLPDPEKFTPQVVESTLNKQNVSFVPNALRRNLFSKKTIVFFSRRQLEMYKVVLAKCSGNPVLLSESKMTKVALCDPNVVVIQYTVSQTSQDTLAQREQIEDIVKYLKSKGKRVIADAEIGLAILYCSTDKYCNADFSFSTEVVKQNPEKNNQAGYVLAQETQEPTQKMERENVIINESLTPSSSKRKAHDDDDSDFQANKKFAPEITNDQLSSETGKRKCDDNSESLNPSKRMAVENDDDIFNFLNNSTATANQSNTEKVLNFTKPAQTKQNTAANDDDPFHFVQDKSKETGDSNNKIFKIKTEMDGNVNIGQKRKLEDESIDLNAMRGTKLKELMENESNLSEYYKNIKIKKEDPDDLERKMEDLDLGSTIITIRKDLIVKKEYIESLDKENYAGHRNFKKFKKVWPVKSHGKVIPKSVMSIVIPDSVAEEITSQSY